jgi:trimeric autotransporter adhesin
MKLQPVRYEYKSDNVLGLKSEGEHIGFGAQDVQKVIPEAVTSNSQGYLMLNSDPIIWTMLNAIKEQQKEIQELKQEVRRLRAAHTARRRR